MNTREEILGIIEKNSRIDVHELSVLMGADEILVANELKALEDEGVICGYHTMIDWSKTDIEKVNALIEVKVTPQRGLGFDSIALVNMKDRIIAKVRNLCDFAGLFVFLVKPLPENTD